ncbi:Asteroid [Phaffia rhodozyma]|uniref:Asteroid n=1 Tax=Phaffia rhodozyma TaxID=264483 RepID=A0A0F7SI22_PHARH|nr:Asteroid [Phaffia rhodozyma]
MGVLGLATYLNENASLVSRPLKFDSVLGVEEEERTKVALVVDAWGLIYELLSHTPWPYGGEHLEFADLLRRTVTGWRAVGIEPVFVYDGPTPPIKFSTELQRQQSLILPISLFHHTSPASRLSRSSWSSQTILPPLFYSTAVDVGLALGVESIWAESEADLRCAYEASKRNGYITGLDSDFTIYGAQGRGAGRGYIPLNQMKWDWVELEQEEEEEPEQEKKADEDSVVIPDEDDDDGAGEFFQVVKSKTHKKNERNRNNTYNTTTGGRFDRKGRWNNRKPSALPPSVPAVSFLTSLSVIIYTPELLAAELDLPLNILPLFAALVGNDYFKYGQAFHHRSATSTQKVDRVSTVLRDCLSPKAKRPSSSNVRSGTATPIETSGDEALLLLSNATSALLLHPRTEQEMEAILHALIDSALSYTIPLELTDLPLSPSSFPPTVSSPSEDDVFGLYVDAVRAGRFAPKLAGVVRDGRYLGRLFIEDTTRASIGKRAGEGIREACWAVLNQGLGIGFREEEEEEEEKEEEKDEDEKMDEDKVDTALEEGDEEDDPTAEAQREELDAILEANAAAGESNAEDPSPAEQDPVEEQDHPSDTRYIQTYLRSGTIFHPTLIPITPITDLLDSSVFEPKLDLSTTLLVLQPLSVRIQAYMHLLGSPSITIRDELKPMVLVIRWIARRLAEEPSKPGVNYHSRRAEIKAIIFTAVRSFHAWSKWQRQFNPEQDSNSTTTDNETPAAEGVSLLEEYSVGELTNRAIHVTSYYLHALHDSDLLAQALLLPRTVFPGPHVFYNGKLAHKSLSDWSTDRAYRPSFKSDEEEKDYESCVEDVLGSEVKENASIEPEGQVDDRTSRKRDKKKAKREKAAAAASGGGGDSQGKKTTKQTGGLGGMFDLLGEMDC